MPTQIAMRVRRAGNDHRWRALWAWLLSPPGDERSRQAEDKGTAEEGSGADGGEG